MADWQASLGEQVHGAVDRDVDCAGILVDPTVGAQGIFFAHADVIQFGALVDFQLRRRELILQVFLIVAVVLRRNAARVRGSICDERADRRLLRLVAIVEIADRRPAR